MQNTALKRFNAPLPETKQQRHFTLYPIRDDANEVDSKQEEIARLLKKEKRCCDDATD